MQQMNLAPRPRLFWRQSGTAAARVNANLSDQGSGLVEVETDGLQDSNNSGNNSNSNSAALQ